MKLSAAMIELSQKVLALTTHILFDCSRLYCSSFPYITLRNLLCCFLNGTSNFKNIDFFKRHFHYALY